MYNLLCSTFGCVFIKCDYERMRGNLSKVNLSLAQSIALKIDIFTRKNYVISLTLGLGLQSRLISLSKTKFWNSLFLYTFQTENWERPPPSPQP